MSSLSSRVAHQPPEMPGEEITTLSSYVLEKMRTCLPKGHSLELITSAQCLVLFRSKGSCAVQFERFTNAEWRLLLALCRTSPQYCPYGTLFAAVSGISVSEGNESIAKAQAHGTGNIALNPMRLALSRLRRKVAPFKIALLSVNTVGYSLAPVGAKTPHRTYENEKEDHNKE